jgi:heat shock protein HslJ
MIPPGDQEGRAAGRALAGLVGAAALVLAACGGSAANPGSPTGPSMAPGGAAGTFALTSLQAAGAPMSIDFYTELDIDTQFGTLSVASDCGVMLGSFSLLDDGRAGVTLAGGRPQDCSPGAFSQQERLVEALARIDTWAKDGDRLILSNAEGDIIVMTRV